MVKKKNINKVNKGPNGFVPSKKFVRKCEDIESALNSIWWATRFDLWREVKIAPEVFKKTSV